MSDRAAAEFGVLVHSIVVESNHLHMVVTDTRGKTSPFMQWFVGMTAKNLIAHYEQHYPDEYLAEIWSKDHFKGTVLGDAEAVIKALSYGTTNPVKDCLVLSCTPGRGSPALWDQDARSFPTALRAPRLR